jgi:hypothetical protein
MKNAVAHTKFLDGQHSTQGFHCFAKAKKFTALVTLLLRRLPVGAFPHKPVWLRRLPCGRSCIGNDLLGHDRFTPFVKGAKTSMASGCLSPCGEARREVNCMPRRPIKPKDEEEVFAAEATEASEGTGVSPAEVEEREETKVVAESVELLREVGKRAPRLFGIPSGVDGLDDLFLCDGNP